MNACGHHHVGHIGILGVDKNGEEWYQVSIGGAQGNDASLGKVIGPSFAAAEMPDVIARLDRRLRRNPPRGRALHRHRAPHRHRSLQGTRLCRSSLRTAPSSTTAGRCCAKRRRSPTLPAACPADRAACASWLAHRDALSRARRRRRLARAGRRSRGAGRRRRRAAVDRRRFPAVHRRPRLFDRAAAARSLWIHRRAYAPSATCCAISCSRSPNAASMRSRCAPTGDAAARRLRASAISQASLYLDARSDARSRGSAAAVDDRRPPARSRPAAAAQPRRRS